MRSRQLSGLGWVILILVGLAGQAALAQYTPVRFGQGPDMVKVKEQEEQSRRELAELAKAGVDQYDVRYLQPLRDLASALESGQQSNRAAEVLERAVIIDRRNPSIPATDRLYDLIHLWYYLGSPPSDKSVSLMQEAVRIARTEHVPDPEVLLRAYGGLAHLSEGKNQYGTADELYVELAEATQQLQGIKSKDKVHVLEHHGNVLEKLKSYGRAEGVYRKLLLVDKSRPTLFRDRVIPDLVRLARVLTAQGRFSEVQEIYDQVIGMSQRQDHFDWPYATMGDGELKAMNELAGILQAHGEIKKAETLYRISLRSFD